MKRAHLALAILLLLSAAAAISLRKISSPRSFAGHGVTWETRSVDIGMLGSMQPIDLKFAFTNNTERALTLLPQACCGFRSHVEPATVEPGGHGIVMVTGETPLSTNGEPDQRNIEVTAREKADFKAIISFSYSVKPIWHPVPRQAKIGPLPEGISGRTTVRVYLERGAPDPVAATCSDKRITIRKGTARAGDFANFELECRSPVGSHDPVSAVCTIDSRDMSFNSIQIPIQVDVLPCVSLKPTKLFLGEFPVSKAAYRTVEIRGREVIKQIKVERAPQGIVVGLGRIDPKRYRARLKITAGKEGPLSAIVTLKITTRHTFTVDIPVVGMATS